MLHFFKKALLLPLALPAPESRFKWAWCSGVIALQGRAGGMLLLLHCS